MSRKVNQVKLPWSFRIRQAWALIVHGEDRRYDEAIATLQEVSERLAYEERDCLQVIDQRDLYHEWADKLADAIADHLGEEIGEHSSANNPWVNALEAIENTPCR